MTVAKPSGFGEPTSLKFTAGVMAGWLSNGTLMVQFQVCQTPFGDV